MRGRLHKMTLTGVIFQKKLGVLDTAATTSLTVSFSLSCIDSSAGPCQSAFSNIRILTDDCGVQPELPTSELPIRVIDLKILPYQFRDLGWA
jgi:hypothetical protein